MNNLPSGSLLVDTAAVYPVPLRTASSGEFGWVRVADRNQAQDLEPALIAAGWSFFSIAGSVRARGFGLQRQSRFETALSQLVRTTKKRGCNCLQIDAITRGWFFGIPCVEVSGHLRRIQKNNFAATETTP